jgi:hypothetical protein
MSARQERDWRLYADDILQACAKVRHIVSDQRTSPTATKVRYLRSHAICVYCVE